MKKPPIPSDDQLLKLYESYLNNGPKEHNKYFLASHLRFFVWKVQMEVEEIQGYANSTKYYGEIAEGDHINDQELCAFIKRALRLVRALEEK